MITAWNTDSGLEWTRHSSLHRTVPLQKRLSTQKATKDIFLTRRLRYLFLHTAKAATLLKLIADSIASVHISRIGNFAHYGPRFK